MKFNPTERLREHSDNYKKTGERINMAGADLSYHIFQSDELLIEGVDMAGADNNVLLIGCGEWKEPLDTFSMEK